MQDEKGYYITALTLAKDASAPCFKPTDRFYSCPIALASDTFTLEAFQWHQNYTKPGRAAFMPAKVSALVYNAVNEIDRILAERDRYEEKKIKRKK